MARRSDDRGGSKGPGPQRAPRDVRRIEHLERENATLIEERDHWKRRIEHLEKELKVARRTGRRQAAPFAKDRRAGHDRPSLLHIRVAPPRRRERRAAGRVKMRDRNTPRATPPYGRNASRQK